MNPDPPDTLDIRILRGRLEAYRGGAPHPVPSEPLQRAALIALALHPGKVLTAPDIAQLCYADPSKREKRISEILALLRHDFPITTRDWQLEVDPESVDAARFARRANALIRVLSDHDADIRAALPDAEQTLTMWGQDPAITFAREVKAPSAFARLNVLHRELATAYIEALIWDGQARTASAIFADHLAQCVDDERVAMLRARLELELRPRPEARAIVRETLHNLPPTPTLDLVGRDDLIEAARQLLRPYPHSQYAILTVDGVGGVGKTALALVIAHSYAAQAETPTEPDDCVDVAPEERFGAVIWTSAKRSVLLASGIYAQHQGLRNLADIYAAIATTMGRPEILAVSEEEQHILVRSALETTRVLLVVDNLETVDDERVLQFLRDLPAPTKAIITTRHRIDGAYPLRLEGLPDDYATELVRRQELDFATTLTDADREELARETAGIPLAIIWTMGQIAAGADVHRAVLHLKSAKGDYAKFCFAEALEFVEQRHGESAVHLLLGIALFSDGAPREALGFVCGLDQRPEERDRGLSALTDLSLVSVSAGRFVMLPLTREYAIAELARDLAFREGALRRFLDWHVQLIARAAGGGADLDPTVLTTLEREHQNILWAIEHALRSEEIDTYVRLLRSMEFFWLGTGRWREFAHYLGAARTLVPEPHDRIHFTGRLIWLAVLRDELDTAEVLVAEAHGLLERFPTDYEKMRIADFEGQLRCERGDWDAAEGLLKESLGIAARLGDRRGQFACNKYLGDVCCGRGDADGARTHLEKAEEFLGWPGEDQWLRGRAYSAHLRGRILEIDGDPEASEAAYRDCISYLEYHADVRLLTKARLGLANVLDARGRSTDAADELRQCRDVLQSLGMWGQVDEIERRLSGPEV